MEKTVNNNANMLPIVNLVLLIVVILLGLTGNFGGEGSGLTQNDVEDAVTTALEDFDFPTTAAAPSAAAPTAAAPTPAPSNKIDTAELEDFYEVAYFKGSEDAKVTVIEFSDFECPFCKRHENQGTLDSVLDKYEGDVNVVFSHFPLSFHPLAQKAQEAAECVGEQGGSDAFYEFKSKIFAEAKPTREAITKVLGEIAGIDAAAAETCIDDGTYAQKVADAMAFGRKLGVTGTPGNIVMNNETGEFQKVSGAVPASAFDSAISSYLN